MATLPATGYLSNPSRTTSEMQVGIDALVESVRQGPGQREESALTIAAGVIAPNRFSHAVDTEGAAASDDLTNIGTADLPDGSLLLIRPVSAARPITVVHNAGGAGQITLANSANRVLSNTGTFLLLRRTGANWTEVSLAVGGSGIIFAVASGTNAITLTPTVPVSRAQFPVLVFVAANTNSAAVTVNEGNGAVALVSMAAAALASGAIIAGTMYMAAWDGTQYRVLGPVGALAFLDAVQAWSRAQRYTPQALTDGATIDWNLDTQPVARVTLGGNRSINAPTNQRDGGEYRLIVNQDGTGSRTLTWNVAYDFGVEGAPVLPTGANKVAIFGFQSNGTSMRCVSRWNN